jgi:hypothetical protein
MWLSYSWVHLCTPDDALVVQNILRFFFFWFFFYIQILSQLVKPLSDTLLRLHIDHRTLLVFIGRGGSDPDPPWSMNVKKLKKKEKKGGNPGTKWVCKRLGIDASPPTGGRKEDSAKNGNCKVVKERGGLWW